MRDVESVSLTCGRSGGKTFFLHVQGAWFFPGIHRFVRGLMSKCRSQAAALLRIEGSGTHMNSLCVEGFGICTLSETVWTAKIRDKHKGCVLQSASYLWAI